MPINRDFLLLKDDRWVVRFYGKYYPIFLPGPPYESRPVAVSHQELEEIEFYEPRDSKSDKAIFIKRSNSEVVVFFGTEEQENAGKIAFEWSVVLCRYK